MKISILLIILVLISGCAHNLTLMARDSNTTGAGVAEGSLFGSTGMMEIKIKETTYNGKYVFSSGGSAGVFGGTTIIMGDVAGNGNAFLASVSGETLRCKFDYSEWTNTGIGACKDGEGTIYDLQID